ncbi:MAG: hypothetical protein ACOCXQ_02540 [Patescibacteria group bacterium]
MKIKKLIGIVGIGLIIASILFGIYRLIMREPELRSPLPEKEGVRVIFITPEVTP